MFDAVKTGRASEKQSGKVNTNKEISFVIRVRAGARAGCSKSFE